MDNKRMEKPSNNVCDGICRNPYSFVLDGRSMMKAYSIFTTKANLSWAVFIPPASIRAKPVHIVSTVAICAHALQNRLKTTL
jgi:hypothetical protein